MAKKQSALARLLRTFAAFFVCVMPVISVAFSASVLTRGRWLIDEATVKAGVSMKSNPEKWTEFSPLYHFCECVDNHQGYCNERNDAFAGTSYLSVVILVAQGMTAAILTLELVAYGLFGGTHTTTKMVLILSMLVLATQILSIISFYTAFHDKHCGDDSFETRGATLGWAFYYRGIELVLTLGFIGYTIRSFARSSRGPPCGTILFQVVFIIVSSISTFSNSWMTIPTTVGAETHTQFYGTWVSCVCHDPCSAAADFDTQLNASFGLTVAQCVVGVITVLFVVLRAVDNEGVTLKFAEGAGLLTLALIAANVGNALGLDADVSCPSAGVQASYRYYSSVELLLLALAAQGAFVITNAIYMLPACAFCSLRALTGQPATPLGALADATVATKKVYHAAWWDHLKDAKTIAHELRLEDDEDDEDEAIEGENSPSGSFNEKDSVGRGSPATVEGGGGGDGADGSGGLQRKPSSRKAKARRIDADDDDVNDEENGQLMQNVLSGPNRTEHTPPPKPMTPE